MLSDDDLVQLEQEGLPPEDARRQMRLFEHPPPFIRLERACTVGDGIRCVSATESEAAISRYDAARTGGRLSKFVPASGAASRMFQTLLGARNADGPISRRTVEQRARDGDRSAGEVLAFMDHLGRFAFVADLADRMAKDGLDARDLAERGEFSEILEYLLTDRGLGSATLPKGLITFHRYPEECRTAFEEHLVEAAAYLRDAHGVCRLHFTVSPEHAGRFQDLYRRVGPVYEQRLQVRFEVTFSIQKRSTDTLAVDLDNRPLRDRDGRLVLRPGGHGALIENLSDLEGDIVFVENIDNVVPDRLKAGNVSWKKTLAGYLLTMQESVLSHLETLSGDAADDAVERAAGFARDVLNIGVPAQWASTSRTERRARLREKLDRPLRVCGMVRNLGEPGGGPFWVRATDGGLSLQIVESAQVDPNDRQQASLFASATHFNPVEIVCALRDWRGRPFDLRRCVDWDAVFIAQKSKDGRELKALERPGLWNGAMADWTTVFVETRNDLFNPVKTINDLLRPQHQPLDEVRK